MINTNPQLDFDELDRPKRRTITAFEWAGKRYVFNQPIELEFSPTGDLDFKCDCYLKNIQLFADWTLNNNGGYDSETAFISWLEYFIEWYNKPTKSKKKIEQKKQLVKEVIDI